MKRKNVFLLAAIVIVLLAVYGVWHYSPLRHLTRSKSQPDQAYSSTIKSRNKPIIVTKKILPETGDSQHTGDLPRPLVVLKKLSPQEKSQLIEPREKSIDPAAAGEKTLQAAPEDSLSAKISEPQTIQPDKPLKPLPAQKKAAPVKQESHRPYSIMLSSCRLPQSARKIVSNYQKVGLAPYVVKVPARRPLRPNRNTGSQALLSKEHRIPTSSAPIPPWKKCKLSCAVSKRWVIRPISSKHKQVSLNWL
jgi:hypothetical protein